MSDFYLFKILSNIKKRDVVAIYGTTKEALEIKKYILEKRKDVKIHCFVEYKIRGAKYQDGIKIIDFKELLEIKNQIDNVIIAKRDNFEAMAKIFRQSDMNYIEITEKNLQKLAYKNFETAKKMIENKQDKDLFTVLYLSSLTDDNNLMLKYLEQNSPREKKHEYLEFINKKAVKTAVDTGENNGYNSMIFQTELKGIEKIYCFDSLHDYVSNGLFISKKEKELTYYKIIQLSSKISLIGKILWDLVDSKQFLAKKVHTTTLDAFRKENNIKIDFIKYDLDALEVAVLRGSKETFKKNRPQIAIRIFQKPCRDYAEIMILLKKLLKNYNYKIGIYDSEGKESVLYCIPKELDV